MAALLALLASLSLGTGDFFGGLASRRAPSLRVTAFATGVGTTVLLIATIVEGSSPDAASLRWGAAAGLVAGAALALLFWSLANGVIAVVSPLSAVLSAAVPVLVGLLEGEDPSGRAVVGLVIAFPAVVLVSSGGPRGDAASRHLAVVAAVAAGVGFGLFAVLIERSSPDSGLWPVLSARGVGFVLLVVSGLVLGLRPGLPPGVRSTAAVAGLLDAAGNALLLLAVRRGLLSLVGVIIALYPAATVALARIVFGERVGRIQLIGMGLAAVAVALIAS
jgi:drug/metabolite transporter (DMT)-like permease